MSGDAGGERNQKAADWYADLIVVGSQNRSAVRRSFPGSVSKKVVIGANCSVPAARGEKVIEKNAPRQIVAGITDAFRGNSLSTFKEFIKAQDFHNHARGKLRQAV
jgi:hypothetical protein